MNMASVILCDFQSKAEVSKIEEQMKKLQNEVDIAHTNFTRLLILMFPVWCLDL